MIGLNLRILWLNQCRYILFPFHRHDRTSSLATKSFDDNPWEKPITWIPIMYRYISITSQIKLGFLYCTLCNNPRNGLSFALLVLYELATLLRNRLQHHSLKNTIYMVQVWDRHQRLTGRSLGGTWLSGELWVFSEYDDKNEK